MGGLITLPALLSGIGTATSVVGGIAQGVNAKRQADEEAAQLKRQGNEELAASQREAGQARQEAVLANSRAQALAAASGGGAGADAPTIIKLMGDTAAAGELNAQSQMYGGLSRRAGYNDQARARRASGKASFLGSTLDSFGTLAKGGYQFGKDAGWIKSK
jgi:hypothetical protein